MKLYFYTLEYRDGINYVSVPELKEKKFCSAPRDFEISDGEEYPHCECIDPAYRYDWEFSPRRDKAFSDAAIEKFTESGNGKSHVQITKNEAECITAEIIRRFLGLDNFQFISEPLLATIFCKPHGEAAKRSKEPDTNRTVRDEKNDPILGKLQNRENAKTFSQKDFDKLAPWGDGISSSGKEPAAVHITERGNKISCDSRDEAVVLEDLKTHHVVKDVRGQSLRIVYENAFGDRKWYYPDIAVLTHENKIAIIEVKSLTAMSYHGNMEKYKGLEAYCRKNGFMYGMIALSSKDAASKKDARYVPEKYTSYEELRDMDIYFSQEFLDLFNAWDLAEDCPWTACNPFTKEQVEIWYKRFGDGLSKREFEIEVHSLILWFKWYNTFKNGFCVYRDPVKSDND